MQGKITLEDHFAIRSGGWITGRSSRPLASAEAPYPTYDLRHCLQGLEAPIGCAVHATWPRREFIHQTRSATKLAPNLARAPVRALGAILELRLIANAIAMTARLRLVIFVGLQHRGWRR